MKDYMISTRLEVMSFFQISFLSTVSYPYEILWKVLYVQLWATLNLQVHSVSRTGRNQFQNDRLFSVCFSLFYQMNEILIKVSLLDLSGQQLLSLIITIIVHGYFLIICWHGRYVEILKENHLVEVFWLALSRFWLQTTFYW